MEGLWMTDKISDVLAHSRPLTAQEEIYWRLTYNDQIHPVLAAEVRGQTTIAQWREALDIVQRHHPLLQVAIEMPDSDNRYFQPMFVRRGDAIIPLRSEVDGGERTIEDEIERELATPFLSGEAPLARVVLLHAPERTVFILAISHSIADGMSALFLIRDVLTAVAGRTLDTIALFPSAEELLGVAPAKPIEAPLDVNETSINAGRRPTVILHSLSIEATADLVATARAHGSTVHAALAAAFVLAMRRLAPQFQIAPLRMISPANTRSELDAPNCLGLYFTSPQSSFEPAHTSKFWDIALQARADIASSSSRDALLGATEAMQSLTKQGLSNHDAAAMLKDAFAMDILLTNLARTPFASNFGELSLERMWGPAVLAGLEHTQTVGVITTNDQLSLTLTSRHPLPHLLEMAVSILADECSQQSASRRFDVGVRV
jgi:hypothetical protein